MEQANDADGQGQSTGGGNFEPTEAEKAAAAALAAETAAPAGSKVSDAEAKLLKEVMQKKDALKASDAALVAANARLKEFEGVDPAAIRKLLADQRTAEESQLEAKGDYDRLKQRMADEHATETKSLKDQIADLEGKLTKQTSVMNELSIGTQFGQSSFIADELTLTAGKARVVYGAHFDLQDGKIVAFDKPRGEADRTPLVNQYGSTLDFDAALRKIVDADPDKDHMLKSKVKPGAGSESKRVDPKAAQKEVPTDSVSKIGAGLMGLNLLSIPK